MAVREHPDGLFAEGKRSGLKGPRRARRSEQRLVTLLGLGKEAQEVAALKPQTPTWRCGTDRQTGSSYFALKFYFTLIVQAPAPGPATSTSESTSAGAPCANLHLAVAPRPPLGTCQSGEGSTGAPAAGLASSHKARPSIQMRFKPLLNQHLQGHAPQLLLV